LALVGLVVLLSRLGGTMLGLVQILCFPPSHLQAVEVRGVMAQEELLHLADRAAEALLEPQQAQVGQETHHQRRPAKVIMVAATILMLPVMAAAAVVVLVL